MVPLRTFELRSRWVRANNRPIFSGIRPPRRLFTRAKYRRAVRNMMVEWIPPMIFPLEYDRPVREDSRPMEEGKDVEPPLSDKYCKPHRSPIDDGMFAKTTAGIAVTKFAVQVTPGQLEIWPSYTGN